MRGRNAVRPWRCHRWRRGNDHPRDGILKDIVAKDSAGWKNDSDHHRLRIAENTMYGVKQLGASLYVRTLEQQVTEAHNRAAIIHTFSYLGKLRLRHEAGWG